MGYNTQFQCVSSLGDASVTSGSQSLDLQLKPKGISAGETAAEGLEVATVEV